MATGADQLELAGAGLTGLLRELLASGGAAGSTIVDTVNPFTPLPTLPDVAQRYNTIKESTQGMQYNLPQDNVFRQGWNAGVTPQIQNLAQQYPNEAELMVDVLSDPNMQGALTLLDGTGVLSAVSAPAKQGIKAAGNAVADTLANPEVQALAKTVGQQFVGRGPADPAQLSAAEVLMGGMLPEVAGQQGVVIPANAMPARARAAGMEDLAVEVEGNLALAQSMIANGASPEEIGRATGLQVTEDMAPDGTVREQIMYEVPSDGASFPLTSEKLQFEDTPFRENAIKSRDDANVLVETARLLNEPERLDGIRAEIEELKGAIADPDAQMFQNVDNPTRNQQIYAAAQKGRLDSVFPSVKKWAADSLKQAGVKNTAKAREKLVTNLLFSAKRKGWDLQPPADLKSLEAQAAKAAKTLEKVEAKTPRTGKMADILEWDLLRALVPEVDNIDYTYNPDFDQKGGYFKPGPTGKRTGAVAIGDLEGAPELGDRPGLGRVHELNHGVEEIFNLPRGGSPKGMTGGTLSGPPSGTAAVDGAVTMFNRLLDSDPAGYPALIGQYREVLNNPNTFSDAGIMDFSVINRAQRTTNRQLDMLELDLKDAVAKGEPVAPILRYRLEGIMPPYEQYRMLRGEASSNTADARFGMSAEEIRANPRVSALQEEALGLRPELQTINGQQTVPGGAPKVYDAVGPNTMYHGSGYPEEMLKRWNPDSPIPRESIGAWLTNDPDQAGWLAARGENAGATVPVEYKPKEGFSPAEYQWDPDQLADYLDLNSQMGRAERELRALNDEADALDVPDPSLNQAIKDTEWEIRQLREQRQDIFERGDPFAQFFNSKFPEYRGRAYDIPQADVDRVRQELMQEMAADAVMMRGTMADSPGEPKDWMISLSPEENLISALTDQPLFQPDDAYMTMARPKYGGRVTNPKVAPLVKPTRPPVFRGGRERPANLMHTIYEDEKILAKEAERNVEPEHPLNKELGISRAEMYDESIRRMQGVDDGFNPGGVSRTGKGAEAANRIITPSNTERLISHLEAFKKYAPGMMEGMVPWYNFESLLRAMSERYGPERALDAIRRTNMFTAPHSANSPVVPEIDRGLAARDLWQVGRFDDWRRGGSNPRAILGLDVDGGMGTKAQTDALNRYLTTGEFGWQAPKVHSYYQASDPVNPQTAWAVGDAHYARSLGLPETRTNAAPYESLTASEVASIGPWWNDIAREAGLPAVPGQAVNWGGFATRTGVKSTVGKPKVEFFLDKVAQLMEREGVSFDDALQRTFGIDGRTYYNVE